MGFYGVLCCDHAGSWSAEQVGLNLVQVDRSRPLTNDVRQSPHCFVFLQSPHHPIHITITAFFKQKLLVLDREQLFFSSVSCFATLYSCLLMLIGNGGSASPQLLWRLETGMYYNFHFNCNSFWKRFDSKKHFFDLVVCVVAAEGFTDSCMNS